MITDETTICAISTAPGMGAIALVRVSGKDALANAGKVIKLANPKETILTQKPNTVRFGRVMDDKDEIVDEVMVSVFHAPHSFSGENLVEIACHGSVFVQQKIVQLLIDCGCVMAGPGEFTQRAFMNGKMDLSQAEAVADVISSTSAAAHRLAMNQMRGGFSDELTKLRAQLLEFTSLMELEMDFSEEDVEFANRDKFKDLARKISEVIKRLVDSFSMGNVLKNGIPVAIIGETNVGKSTLLNVLLNEERAIVSDIHGTTRDVIEDTVVIGGVNFRFIDTAGLRTTTDKVETLGIERALQKMKQANIVLLMIDATESTEHISQFVTDTLCEAQLDEGQKWIAVFNKQDQIDVDKLLQLQSFILPAGMERLFISAKEKINTDALQDSLMKAAQIPTITSQDIIVTNVRHYEALKKALDAINRVSVGLQTNLSIDMVSQDVRECIYYLGEITGVISTDEVLGNIFSHFCIGK